MIIIYTNMCQTITVKEFFEQSWISLEDKVDCTKKIQVVNMALEYLWNIVYFFPWMVVSEDVDISLWLHQTEFPIYKVMWWFGIWCSDCIVDNEMCADSWCDSYCRWRYWYMPYMRNVSHTSHLQNSEYQLNCFWEKNITYVLPHWTTDAYVVYTKYFDRIKDINEQLPIPRYLLPALTLLIAYFNAVNNNDENIAYYMNDFTSYIQQLARAFQNDSSVPAKFVWQLLK